MSDPRANVGKAITVDDVRRIVFVAFTRDETVMGVGFPKEERAAMVAAEPDKRVAAEVN